MNRVLVVDDEASVIETLSGQIEAMGFTVFKAYDAEAALRIFKKEKPGIVITDLRLGAGMDGVALCSRIRYDEPGTVIVAMSGYFNSYDKVFCLGAGFSDFITKPIDTNDLYSALQCAFDRRNRWMMIP